MVIFFILIQPDLPHSHNKKSQREIFSKWLRFVQWDNLNREGSLLCFTNVKLPSTWGGSWGSFLPLCWQRSTEGFSCWTAFSEPTERAQSWSTWATVKNLVFTNSGTYLCCGSKVIFLFWTELSDITKRTHCLPLVSLPLCRRTTHWQGAGRG